MDIRKVSVGPHGLDRSIIEHDPGRYSDAGNNIFLGRRFERKLWRVTSRGANSVTDVHSSHRSLPKALDAMERVIHTYYARY